MEHMEKTSNPSGMNQDIFAGQWKQMRGTLRAWWGKLTDDDWNRIAGQKDKLIGMLQEKYGYTKDMAQREVERRFREYSSSQSGGSGWAGSRTTSQPTSSQSSSGSTGYSSESMSEGREHNSGSMASVSHSGQATPNTEEMYHRAAKTYDELKHKGQEIGATAADKMSHAASTVGEKMSSLAGSLRQKVPHEGNVGSAANVVADQLEAAGSYLQENTFDNMSRDLTALIRRYPVQSLLVGLGIGYLLTRRSER